MSTPGAGRFVGHSVPRREDRRLVTGHGHFVDDVTGPGMLHAAFVRSDVARARMTRLDVDAARALDGVLAVLTAADLNPVAGPMQPTMFVDDLRLPRPPLRPLAADDVRFVGEPIALVVAESRYVAEDACELVEVDYEAHPPVLDLDDAIADSHLVHPEVGSNVALDVATPPDPALDEIFATAPHVVTQRVVQHRYLCVPMETRGVVSAYDPVTGRLDVWLATQHPHEARLTCARLTGVPEHDVRVRMDDVGGGFGLRYFVQRDEQVVVLASRVLGRTIKWIEDRRENLIASAHARMDVGTVRLALDDDGRILGTHLDHVEEAGAFPVGGTGGVGPYVGMLFPGPYRVPRAGWRSRVVFTNTCGRGAYRGPWMFETVAREQVLDAAARRLGLDPLELRRRNVLHATDLPYTTATRMALDRVTPAETLEQAAGILGYDDFRGGQEAARADGRLLGVGIGLYVEPTASAVGSLGVEAATVRVEPGGTVTAFLGTGSHGQGVETTMAQVVAEHLGVDYDAVRVVQGDTAVTPFGGGTGGSRTALVAASAARDAALQVRELVLGVASHLLEAAPEDLELESGSVSVRGTPVRAVALGDVARAAYNAGASLPPGTPRVLEATGRFVVPPATWSNACHVCAVEVERHTGLVDVQRYVVSEDCGVMIHPAVVEGQVAGGVVQGIGGVLYEHFVYDDDGNPLTTTFLDYLLPTAAEAPDVEHGHVETPAPTPGGYKGMGEGGAIGSPPAVVNAVADALALVGAIVPDQPLTPSRVLAALRAARA